VYDIGERYDQKVSILSASADPHNGVNLNTNNYTIASSSTDIKTIRKMKMIKRE
jgi:hypothetical protein